jgi:DNA mismatch endonuclease (patch repair protein)
MEKLLRSKLAGGTFQDIAAAHSRLMQRVRGRGNRTTEARLRAALVCSGLRGWKLNSSTVFGKPDVFFPLRSVAIFVDGCFWHGCPQCGHVPNKNRDYWRAKFRKNRARDRKVTAQLTEAGVKVVRFWEHDLQDDLSSCLVRVKTALKGRHANGGAITRKPKGACSGQ